MYVQDRDDGIVTQKDLKILSLEIERKIIESEQRILKLLQSKKDKIFPS